MSDAMTRPYSLGGRERFLIMEIFRSPMEKLLKQMEDNEVITNPKQMLRSMLYKFVYRCCYQADRLSRAARHLLHRP